MTISRSRPSGQAETGFGFALGCGVVVVVLAVLGFLTMVHVVDPGFVGVVTSFGKVQTETLKPGPNFLFPPFFYSVTNVDTRVHGITFGTDPNAPFGAASIEYQDVFLQGTLNIHIDQNAAVDLYQKVGLDYDQKLVVPFFTTAIKEVVPQYHVGDILSKREEIRRLTVEKLQAKLAPYGIIVDDVAIANIDFSAQYKKAIEDKQTAEQQVLTETQILAQKKIQAQQVTTTAQGAADAVIISAKAQAEANRLLQLSLTPELLQYTLINKIAPGIQTLILPAGQNFILDPKALVPGASAAP